MPWVSTTLKLLGPSNEGGSQFTPADLPVQPVVWLEAIAGTVFSDEAGTTAANPNDVVLRWIRPNDDPENPAFIYASGASGGPTIVQTANKAWMKWVQAENGLRLSEDVVLDGDFTIWASFRTSSGNALPMTAFVGNGISSVQLNTTTSTDVLGNPANANSLRLNRILRIRREGATLLLSVDNEPEVITDTDLGTESLLLRYVMGDNSTGFGWPNTFLGAVIVCNQSIFGTYYWNAIDYYLRYLAQDQDFTPPTAPTSLSVDNIAAAVVTLSWTDGVDDFGVLYSVVERSADNGQTWTVAGTSDSQGLDDDTATYNTTFLYRVKTVDQSGNVSDYSDTVSAVIGGFVGASSAPGAGTLTVPNGVTQLVCSCKGLGGTGTGAGGGGGGGWAQKILNVIPGQPIDYNQGDPSGDKVTWVVDIATCKADYGRDSTDGTGAAGGTANVGDFVNDGASGGDGVSNGGGGGGGGAGPDAAGTVGGTGVDGTPGTGGVDGDNIASNVGGDGGTTGVAASGGMTGCGGGGDGGGGAGAGGAAEILFTG